MNTIMPQKNSFACLFAPASWAFRMTMSAQRAAFRRGHPARTRARRAGSARVSSFYIYVSGARLFIICAFGYHYAPVLGALRSQDCSFVAQDLSKLNKSGKVFRMDKKVFPFLLTFKYWADIIETYTGHHEIIQAGKRPILCFRKAKRRHRGRDGRISWAE